MQFNVAIFIFSAISIVRNIGRITKIAITNATIALIIPRINYLSLLISNTINTALMHRFNFVVICGKKYIKIERYY